MATLTLKCEWFNLVDTGEGINACTLDRDEEHVTSGDVRTYAGGRRRSITQEGVERQLSLTLVKVSTVDLQKLESWCGRAVQYRDHRGRRIFGVFFKIGITEHELHADEYKLGLTLYEVTMSEAVC